jgi:hypothetical protein
MITVTTFSEAGGHLTNEDAFEVRQQPLNQDGWLCALADGQGGQAGGARAAQLACCTAIEGAMSHALKKRFGLHTWPAILQKADQVLSSDPTAGFTTLVGFSIAGGALVGASSGDSAVLVASGKQQPREVTAEQWKNPPVGSRAARFVPFAVNLESPWYVLAMSDGVWKYVGLDAIIQAACLERGERLLMTLQEKARLGTSRRFQDDFTAVLFEAAS